MTIDELAQKELELYSIVTSLSGTMEELNIQIQKLGVFDEYKKIHEEYAKLNKNDGEALKRGLFLIWYSRSEPSCFTGLSELNFEAENMIINNLNKYLNKNKTDYELDWMLSYYSNWDYVFDQFKKYESFHARLKNNQKVEMPDKIDREEMKNRGQMGLYWNSLDRYSNK